MLIHVIDGADNVLGYHEPTQNYPDVIMRVNTGTGTVELLIPHTYVTVAALDVLRVALDEYPVSWDFIIDLEGEVSPGYYRITYHYA